MCIFLPLQLEPRTKQAIVSSSPFVGIVSFACLRLFGALCPLSPKRVAFWEYYLVLQSSTVSRIPPHAWASALSVVQWAATSSLPFRHVGLHYFHFYFIQQFKVCSQKHFLERLVCHIPGYGSYRSKHPLITAPGGFIPIFPSTGWLDTFFKFAYYFTTLSSPTSMVR